MHRKQLFFTFVILISLVWILAAQAIAAPPTPWTNLLQNPRFDEGLEGWIPWYYEDIVKEKDRGQYADINLQLSLFEPYFDVSEYKWDRETRGKDEDMGAAGMVSGRRHTRFRAGFFQTAYVAPGSRVGFTVWVNGFCEDEKQDRCPVLLRAGIDPTGGTDWRSPNIRWVEVQISDQEYRMLIAPQVQVPDGRVTVFLWGEPRYPVIYNAAYFDDATLIVTVPPTPTGAAPTAPPPPPTPTPCAQMRVVSETVTPHSEPVAPGTHLVKTWHVQNSGTCAWSGRLGFLGSGNRMGNTSEIILPQVQVGESTDIRLDLIAPVEPGSYQGTWEARADDGTILGRLIVTINVIGTTPTPPPAQAAPEGPAASPTPGGSQICATAFNDRNGDGQQSPDEGLLAGVVITLSGPGGPEETYTTDAIHEPHCFRNLQPGTNVLAMVQPAGYRATTVSKWTTLLVEDAVSNFVFGAAPGEPAATSTLIPNRKDSFSGVQAGMDGTRRIAVTTAAVLILLNLGLAIIVSVRHR